MPTLSVILAGRDGQDDLEITWEQWTHWQRVRAFRRAFNRSPRSPLAWPEQVAGGKGVRASAPDVPMPRCCIAGCVNEVVYEVHDWHYAKLFKRLRGIERKRGWERRRASEERFFACEEHVSDARLAGVGWQFLIKEGL
jgi:hypothetical protein